MDATISAFRIPMHVCKLIRSWNYVHPITIQLCAFLLFCRPEFMLFPHCYLFQSRRSSVCQERFSLQLFDKFLRLLSESKRATLSLDCHHNCWELPINSRTYSLLTNTIYTYTHAHTNWSLAHSVTHTDIYIVTHYTHTHTHWSFSNTVAHIGHLLTEYTRTHTHSPADRDPVYYSRVLFPTLASYLNHHRKYFIPLAGQRSAHSASREEKLTILRCLLFI